jgi:predicted SAM-dependent methyltransferase
MELIQFKNKTYPKFQSQGNAAKFAIPYAQMVCNGVGVDIGCNRKEWSFPNSIPIDLQFNDGYSALNLPDIKINYIFSSHCLEHIPNWVEVMNYWYDKLENEGILFLYLPHYSQEYWKPWNNRKHLHIFTPEIINDYMKDKGYKNIFRSEKDLNDSFMIFGEK